MKRGGSVEKGTLRALIPFIHSPDTCAVNEKGESGRSPGHGGDPHTALHPEDPQLGLGCPSPTYSLYQPRVRGNALHKPASYPGIPKP